MELRALNAGAEREDSFPSETVAIAHIRARYQALRLRLPPRLERRPHAPDRRKRYSAWHGRSVPIEEWLPFAVMEREIGPYPGEVFRG